MSDMDAETIRAMIETDNDQHSAAAIEWVFETSWEELMIFWMWLNSEHEDGYIEYASRLAQIALAPMMAERFEREVK